jgi:hypothetical protein
MLSRILSYRLVVRSTDSMDKYLTFRAKELLQGVHRTVLVAAVGRSCVDTRIWISRCRRLMTSELTIGPIHLFQRPSESEPPPRRVRLLPLQSSFERILRLPFQTSGPD